MVAENWLFTIIILGVLITGLPLLRDVLYDFMGIYGGIILPTPSEFSFLHIVLGFILIIFGLLHIAIHSKDTKSELLIKKPINDFKIFFHSLFYLIGFAKREEMSGGERYNGRQRIVYLALVYTIGLLVISGVSMFIISGKGFFYSIYFFTHILSAILIILVLLFHLAINIRHHDSLALKCNFVNGKLPIWYIKKNHKIWYLKILKHEEKLAKQTIKPIKQKTTDPVAKAFIKLYSIDGIDLPADIAEKLAEKLRKNNNPKDIARFIEISKTI